MDRWGYSLHKCQKSDTPKTVPSGGEVEIPPYKQLIIELSVQDGCVLVGKVADLAYLSFNSLIHTLNG